MSLSKKIVLLLKLTHLLQLETVGVLALDAKLNFDDNALFRHKDILELRDLEEEDPKEIEASKYDLSYIALDGDIGCMVNGAGLAMATWIQLIILVEIQPTS